jgi:hypothetical protein
VWAGHGRFSLQHKGKQEQRIVVVCVLPKWYGVERFAADPVPNGGLVLFAPLRLFLRTCTSLGPGGRYRISLSESAYTNVNNATQTACQIPGASC